MANSAFGCTICGHGVHFTHTRHPRAIMSIWSGTGNGGAPDPELHEVGVLGADQDGVPGATLYHVVGAPGSRSWQTTGSTVQKFYGN